MQLLSLASLASEQHELPYNVVAESLQIKPEEVEHWIISAIGAKLIDAKMDQLRRVVLVTYVVSFFATYYITSLSFNSLYHLFQSIAVLLRECSLSINGSNSVDLSNCGEQTSRTY